MRCTIDPVSLATMLTRAAVVASRDPSRPHLGGILLEVEGSVLRVVSTDGHRMAVLEHTVQDAVSGTLLVDAAWARGAARRLPRARFAKGARVDKHPPFTLSDTHVEGPGIRIDLALGEGPFPPWRRVVPEDRREVTQDPVGVDLVYLSDARAVLGDGGCTVRLGGALDPILFVAEDRDMGIRGRYVVMPMRT